MMGFAGDLRVGKSLAGTMENQDLLDTAAGLELRQRRVLARGEAGAGLRQESRRVWNRLGVPRDPRGIVLACGYAGAAALGVAALVSVGDPIGFAYLLIALTGYVFLQTRLLPAFLWLLVSAYAAWSAVSGASVNWIGGVLALVLAAVALLPTADPARDERPVRSVADSIKLNPLAAGGNGSTSARLATESHVEPDQPDRPAAAPKRLRCVGPFSFEVSGEDIATSLEGKAVLSFLFKYLLARWVLGEPKVGRSAIGDELTPGVAEASQRDRLRKQLFDLRRDAGPELGALLRSNRSHVWLDLSGIESDIGDLRRLSDEVRVGGRLISAKVEAEIEDLLSQTQGQEFLEGFEELENHVNKGRGTAGQTVADARLSLEEQQAELIRALAEYQDTLGRPEAAIPHLRSGLKAMPSRQDLARLLATAYLKTGQPERASEVRSQFGLNKE